MGTIPGGRKALPMVFFVTAIILVLFASVLAWTLGQFYGWSLRRVLGVWLLVVSLPIACLSTILKMKKFAAVFWVLAVVETLWLLYDSGMLHF